MRHRICEDVHTGLGSPDKALLDNKWSKSKSTNVLLKTIMDSAIDLYFSAEDGCDFQIIENDKETAFILGIEPTYKFDKLKIIKISTTKNESYIQTGEAFGFYGSGIKSRTKRYDEYKYESKFVCFIDRWHNEMSKLYCYE